MDRAIPDLILYRTIVALWLIALAIWLISARSTKPAARVEGAGSRLPHLILTTAAFFLIFNVAWTAGPFDARFLPDTLLAHAAGIAITAAGLAIAIWARMIIGANWSGLVTVRQNHELIRRGPYAIVRHPIYSGLLLGLLGTAIAFGQWRDLVGFALAFIGWRTKSLTEERFMTEQFGEQYIRYKREVKALIPFVL